MPAIAEDATARASIGMAENFRAALAIGDRTADPAEQRFFIHQGSAVRCPEKRIGRLSSAMHVGRQFCCEALSIE
jgi:hypothetical protein